MNKSLLVGSVLGAITATAGGAYAGLEWLKKPQFAEVTQVTPLTETIQTPREECRDETVVHRRAVQDESRIAGTVIGALVGGVLGKQVGGGSGRKIATVAGAAAGGYAGNRVQKGMQDRDTYTTTEKRCKTVYDNEEKTVGYQVRYVLDGEPGQVRMDHDPGPRIPVKNGLLVLEEPEVPAVPAPQGDPI
ncbi:MAG: glycine zipper 2TM domain-containing protein [Gammaproteobacteria bacterium]|nr:glycine zipper 2TM domain-containing protein [Gammaproteobacteria bacterium]